MHRVIYHLLEDIGNMIVDKAPGTSETQVAGEAEVLNIFELKGKSKAKGGDVKIAGCRVVDGCFYKSSTMRLLRSGEVVFEGSIQEELKSWKALKMKEQLHTVFPTIGLTTRLQKKYESLDLHWHQSGSYSLKRTGLPPQKL